MRDLARSLPLVALLVLAGCSGPFVGGSPTPSPTAPGAHSTTPTVSPTATGTPETASPNATRVVLHDFDPSYDPDRVLDRVERIRGLEATGPIHLHELAFSVRGPTDLPDRTGTIEPAGARALQLASSAAVEHPVAPGWATRRDDGVHLTLLNGSAARGAYGLPGELVLAHEYVHALQYQHGLYDGSVYRNRTTTDGRLAARMVLEGDAAAVAWRYHERYLPDAGSHRPLVNRSGTRARWTFALGRGAYFEGLEYVTERDPSPERRAELLRNPPATTARLLHPDREFDRPALPTPIEADDLRIVHRDRIGELAVRRPFRINGVGYARASDIAAGWRNDTMYYYADAETGPVHWTSRWANASEAREFADAWRRLLDRRNATRNGDLLTVPATDTTAEVHYVVRREGDTVHVTAGTDRKRVRRLAAVWEDRHG